MITPSKNGCLKNWHLYIGVAFMLLLLLAPVAKAQQGVAAIVNDEIITSRDLEQRVLLAALGNGQSLNLQAMQRLAPQVLRMLIDEKIKLQAAATNNITITPDEIEAQLQRIAQQQNMSLAGLAEFFTQNGVDISYLRHQIEAQLIWRAYIGRKYARNVDVTPEEIDEALTIYKQNLGKPQRLLAEIFLGNDTKDAENTLRQIMEQLRSGANFAALARALSQAPSAARGGDLGWVPKGDMPDEVEAALDNMQKGRVTLPIETLTGFYIVLLRDQREGSAQLVDALAEQLDIRLISLAIPADLQSGSDIAPPLPPAFEEALEDIEENKGAEFCASLPQLSKDLRQNGWNVNLVALDGVKLNSLRPEWQSALASLNEGELSRPLIEGDKWQILALCQRYQDENALAGLRAQIEERLKLQKFSNLERRHLRDLRRAAFINVKR